MSQPGEKFSLAVIGRIPLFRSAHILIDSAISSGFKIKLIVQHNNIAIGKADPSTPFTTFALTPTVFWVGCLAYSFARATYSIGRAVYSLHEPIISMRK
jgi:hypothetical protein